MDETDDSGWTALHCASYKGNYRLISLLLEKGADSTITNPEGTTALIYFLRFALSLPSSGGACCSKRLLLCANRYSGGLREMGTKEEEEPDESLMTLRKFIESGANLNAQNSNGECTPSSYRIKI